MAKRLCPNCKNPVSHKSTTCPHCNNRIPAVSFWATDTGKATFLIIGIFLVFFFIGRIIAPEMFETKESSNRSETESTKQKPVEDKIVEESEQQYSEQEKAECLEYFSEVMRVYGMTNRYDYGEWLIDPAVWSSFNLVKKEGLLNSLSDCRKIVTSNIRIIIRDSNSGEKLGKGGAFGPKVY